MSTTEELRRLFSISYTIYCKEYLYHDDSVALCLSLSCLRFT